MGTLRHLTPEQHRQYERVGVTFPVTVLSSAEAADYRQRLMAFLEHGGWPLDASTRHKPHLYLKWVSDLVHHPAVVGAVADVLGPNVLLWRSTFFIKPPRDPSYVAWHQDSVYWRLGSDDVATAWIALTDSTPENGCVRIVEGSHRWPEMPHRMCRDADNVLLRGQSAAVAIPEEHVTNVPLEAGQLSLHHVRTLHGSLGNRSDTWRAGVAVRCIASHVRQPGARRSATLLCGVDTFRHFDHEPVPRFDYDPTAMQWHARSVRGYATDLVRDLLRHPTPTHLMAAARIAMRPATVRVAVSLLAQCVKPRRAVGATGRPRS